MTPEQEFLESIKKGDLAKVKCLLDETPMLLHAAGEVVSPLLSALYHRHQKIVAFFLSQNVQLNLFEAAAVGDSKRMAELIETAPDRLHAVSPDGFSLLGLAAFFGHPKVAGYLIEKGADVDAPSRNAARVRPLHSALAHRDPEVSFAVAQRLIEGGADVNATQAGGWTPLHQAAVHGQVGLATLLLDRGADINAAADNGKTPLALAISGKQKELAVLLRERGARP
ncbi:MAG: ankyrin repeat domain-containing protein [Nitrospirae bacterium]|nr:ankyrin repeat domain-containing protein [Candidatus Manganitrophaceae bacterium]